MSEELKTVEDINEEFRKDNTPQRLSGDEFNDMWEEKLKFEGGKLVKAKNFMTDEGINVIDTEWIKHFFNLTERDLEEKEDE